MNVFVICNHWHCSIFVKRQRRAEALTLISPLKLIVDYSLIRKTVKPAKLHSIPAFLLSILNFSGKFVKYFVVAVAAFLFLSVLCIRPH